MKSLIAVLFAMFALAGDLSIANATTRQVTYPAEIPLSTTANQLQRDVRIANGVLLRDLLGATVANQGIYTNLSVLPNGGMYLAVAPTTAGAYSALYQTVADDPKPLPVNASPQLPADFTSIVVPAFQTVSTGITQPLTAPNSGTSQYYLVEAQEIPTDTVPLAIALEDVYGNKTFATPAVPTQRQDVIVYQVKPGTAAPSSPAVPATDPGWVPIAKVLIPSGTTAITQAMISPFPPFGGFVANGSALTVSSLTLPTVATGCLQVLPGGGVSSLPCTSGVGTVNGTFPIATTQSSGVVNVTCATCVTSVSGSGSIASTGGTSPTLSLAAVISSPEAFSNAVNFGGLQIGGAFSTSTPSINYDSAKVPGINIGVPSGATYGRRTFAVGSSTSSLTQIEQLDANGNYSVPGTGTFGGVATLNGSTGGNPFLQFPSYCTTTQLGVQNSAGPQGIYPNLFGARCIGGGYGFAVDTGGNVGILGSLTAQGITSQGNIATNNGVINAPTATLQLCAFNTCHVDIASNGDISTYRGDGTGVVFLGSQGGSHYLYFDGSNYNLNSAGLNIGGGLTTSGSFAMTGNTNLIINGSAQIGSNNGASAAGIGCNVLAVAQVNVAWRLCQDTSGNIGITGAYYEASRRSLKNHIAPLTGPQALDWIEHTDWATFAYKSEHAKTWTHAGLIADNSPSAFSGPHHNRMDVAAVGAAAAVAVKYQQREISDLRSRVAALAPPPTFGGRLHELFFGS